MTQVEAAFWCRVKEGAPDECWEWVGAVQPRGAGVNYGKFSVASKYWAAHRFSWYLVFGLIPEGKVIMHTCDTPLCVNPAHLRLGTLGDNNADRHRKGRSYSKLTAAQVIEARSRYKPRSKTNGSLALSREYGVSRNGMNVAIHGKICWKDLDTRATTP